MPAPVPEIKHVDERSSPGIGTGETIEQEAFSTFPCDLSYSCLLIPRFSTHYLTGDITEYLAEWMRQICVSYGWRLDAIVVRPGYIQWVITVPPSANPAQFIRLTRKHTSQKIFDEFPRFKLLNMSGDFWAPGYYVTSGNQLLSLDSISNFTVMTRRQQGIY
jgi:REP element-mobilizing transposase RayT